METNQDYSLNYSSVGTSSNAHAPTRTIEDRLWIDAQISRFDNLLRTLYDKTLESFAEAIITELSELVNAVKGAFFVTDFENHRAVIVAGYACTPATVARPVFTIGEDLIGHAVKSGKMRYLENIDSQHTGTHSSLVSINTKAVIILPLVFNELVYGVIELNCIKPLEPREIDLLKSLSRNIASMLQSIQNNARTKKLLEELRQKNNDMAQQEEELRQNLEELQSTQEAMERKQKEVEQLLEEIRHKEANLNSLINNSADQILAVNKDLQITLMNVAMRENLRMNYGLDIEIGSDITQLFPPEQYDYWTGIYKRCLNGERIVTEQESETKGQKTYSEVMFNPIVNDTGEIIGVAVFSRDITARKLDELALKQKNDELKKAEELLRKNLETLNQTKEKLQIQQQKMQETIDLMERNKSYTIALIDNLPYNVMSFDLNYNILIHNKKVREFYRQMGVEIKTGMNVFDLILPHEQPKFKAIYDRVINDSEVVRLDDSYEFNGQTHVFRMTFAPVFSITDEVIGILAYSEVLGSTVQSQERKKSR